MARKTKPWERPSWIPIDCKYNVGRQGSLLWIRGNFPVDKATESGFRWSPNHGAFYLHKDPSEALPEFLQKVVRLEDPKESLSDWIKENLGKLRAEITISNDAPNGKISEEFKTCVPRRLQGTKERGIAVDLAAQQAFEAGKIRDPYVSDLYSALELEKLNGNNGSRELAAELAAQEIPIACKRAIVNARANDELEPLPF